MTHKLKIDKFESNKIKNACALKDTIKKITRQAIVGKIFANHMSDK